MSDRGAVSIIVVTGALALCVMALGAADLGSMLVARSRAQTAADGAALAAAVVQVAILGQQGTPEEEARAFAERNSAELARCSCEQGDAVAEVEVHVRPRLVFLRPWFGRIVRAVARAEVDRDVLSYREPG
jgi:secretion/DNA translocation related TadE-like protein